MTKIQNAAPIDLIWRAMTPADLPAVIALADRIHPDLPEDAAVFESRLRLFPGTTLVLARPGQTLGYAIAHPIAGPVPPPLGTVLTEWPEAPDTLYIHDVALDVPARGAGLADDGVERLIRGGAGLRKACLISVYGTAAFWSRFGFIAVPDAVPQEKLASYGPGAVYMTRPL